MERTARARRVVCVMSLVFPGQLGVHPNLVALHDFFETPLHGGLEQYAVVTEFIGNGARDLLGYMFTKKKKGSSPPDLYKSYGRGEMYNAERDEVAPCVRRSQGRR